MMRSKLFQMFDLVAPDNEAFLRDVDVLAQLSEEQLTTFLEAVPRLSALATDAQQVQLIEEVGNATGRAAVEVAYILRALQLFMTGFLDEKTASDTPEDLVADLREADAVAPEAAENLQRLLIKIREFAPQSRDALEASTAVHRVLPNVAGFHTSVELRAILKREFDAGTPVAEYKPDIRDAAPIVSVRLMLDGGPAQDVCFQLTKDGARRIADTLLAAAITLDEFERLFRKTQDLNTMRAPSTEAHATVRAESEV